MSGTHLHIVLNHLPVTLAMITLLVLIFGVLRKSADIQRLGLGLMVLLAVFGATAFFTGPGAAKFYEGNDFYQSRIQRHRDSAGVAWLTGLAVGAVGVTLIVLSRKSSTVPLSFMAIAAVVLSAQLFLLARTSNLGGQVTRPILAEDAASKMLGTD
ncbi:MAG: hypothetical protein IH944_03840 [Armatimonadetes bacterium]|nr:hypothetical protein [Armatimonadota bacterium]